MARPRGVTRAARALGVAHRAALAGRSSAAESAAAFRSFAAAPQPRSTTGVACVTHKLRELALHFASEPAAADAVAAAFAAVAARAPPRAWPFVLGALEDVLRGAASDGARARALAAAGGACAAAGRAAAAEPEANSDNDSSESRAAAWRIAPALAACATGSPGSAAAGAAIACAAALTEPCFLSSRAHAVPCSGALVAAAVAHACARPADADNAAVMRVVSFLALFELRAGRGGAACETLALSATRSPFIGRAVRALVRAIAGGADIDVQAALSVARFAVRRTERASVIAFGLLHELYQAATLAGGDTAAVESASRMLRSAFAFALAPPADRGLPRAALDALPLRRAAAAGECAVCLEDVAAGVLVRALPCAHAFHAKCVDPWLQRNASCPTCRARLEPAAKR